MGIRIAQALSYPMVNDYIPLGNGEFVVEIEISKQVDGKTLDTVLGKGDQPIHALAVKRRAETTPHPPDRKSVVSGKSVPVRVDLGGRRIIKKTKKTQYSRIHNRQ